MTFIALAVVVYLVTYAIASVERDQRGRPGRSVGLMLSVAFVAAMVWQAAHPPTP